MTFELKKKREISFRKNEEQFFSCIRKERVGIFVIFSDRKFLEFQSNSCYDSL